METRKPRQLSPNLAGPLQMVLPLAFAAPAQVGLLPGIAYTDNT